MPGLSGESPHEQYLVPLENIDRLDGESVPVLSSNVRAVIAKIRQIGELYREPSADNPQEHSHEVSILIEDTRKLIRTIASQNLEEPFDPTPRLLQPLLGEVYRNELLGQLCFILDSDRILCSHADRSSFCVSVLEYLDADMPSLILGKFEDLSYVNIWGRFDRDLIFSPGFHQTLANLHTAIVKDLETELQNAASDLISSKWKLEDARGLRLALSDLQSIVGQASGDRQKLNELCIDIKNTIVSLDTAALHFSTGISPALLSSIIHTPAWTETFGSESLQRLINTVRSASQKENQGLRRLAAGLIPGPTGYSQDQLNRIIDGIAVVVACGEVRRNLISALFDYMRPGDINAIKDIYGDSVARFLSELSSRNKNFGRVDESTEWQQKKADFLKELQGHREVQQSTRIMIKHALLHNQTLEISGALRNLQLLVSGPLGTARELGNSDNNILSAFENCLWSFEQGATNAADCHALTQALAQILHIEPKILLLRWNLYPQQSPNYYYHEEKADEPSSSTESLMEGLIALARLGLTRAPTILKDVYDYAVRQFGEIPDKMLALLIGYCGYALNRLGSATWSKALENRSLGLTEEEVDPYHSDTINSTFIILYRFNPVHISALRAELMKLLRYSPEKFTRAHILEKTHRILTQNSKGKQGSPYIQQVELLDRLIESEQSYFYGAPSQTMHITNPALICSAEPDSAQFLVQFDIACSILKGSHSPDYFPLPASNIRAWRKVVERLANLKDSLPQEHQARIDLCRWVMTAGHRDDGTRPKSTVNLVQVINLLSERLMLPGYVQLLTRRGYRDRPVEPRNSDSLSKFFTLLCLCHSTQELQQAFHDSYPSDINILANLHSYHPWLASLLRHNENRYADVASRMKSISPHAKERELIISNWDSLLSPYEDTGNCLIPLQFERELSCYLDFCREFGRAQTPLLYSTYRILKLSSCTQTTAAGQLTYGKINELRNRFDQIRSSLSLGAWSLEVDLENPIDIELILLAVHAHEAEFAYESSVRSKLHRFNRDDRAGRIERHPSFLKAARVNIRKVLPSHDFKFSRESLCYSRQLLDEIFHSPSQEAVLRDLVASLARESQRISKGENNPALSEFAPLNRSRTKAIDMLCAELAQMSPALDADRNSVLPKFFAAVSVYLAGEKKLPAALQQATRRLVLHAMQVRKLIDAEVYSLGNSVDTTEQIPSLLNFIKIGVLDHGLAILERDLPGLNRDLVQQAFSPKTFPADVDRFYRYVWRDSPEAASVPIEFIPTRGIVAELSGYLCDVCWIKTDRIMVNHPNMSFILFSQPLNQGPPRTVGGTMVMSARSENGDPVLVIRGFNPLQKLGWEVRIPDLFEAFVDYLATSGMSAGFKHIVIPDDATENIAQTNRQFVNTYVRGKYRDAPKIRLAAEPNTKFNGESIWDRCIIIR